MDNFPAVDPIPIPAPVWVFKFLLLLTLTLHFTALFLTIGGLAVATVWAIGARRAGAPAVLGQGAGAIVARLPITLAYVINLGVPPLLFAQVLYGRAFYTSSILIGAYWLGVIGLLSVAYTLLYVMERRAREGKPWWLCGVVAAGCIGMIALIYVNNMTLMIRPNVWLEVYRGNPHGTQLAHGGDPTVAARWHYMMAAALMNTGVGLMLFGLRRDISAELKGFLRVWGGLIAAVFAVCTMLALAWVLSVQPAQVQSDLGGSGPYRAILLLWFATAVTVAALGGLSSLGRGREDRLFTVGAAVAGFLNIALWVVFRDGIRDASLRRFGFDVWDRVVVINWSVLIAFFLMFVAGLAATGWLAKVVLAAKGEYEGDVGIEGDGAAGPAADAGVDAATA
jgi:hypothetical protein